MISLPQFIFFFRNVSLFFLLLHIDSVQHTHKLPSSQAPFISVFDISVCTKLSVLTNQFIVAIGLVQFFFSRPAALVDIINIICDKQLETKEKIQFLFITLFLLSESAF